MTTITRSAPGPLRSLPLFLPGMLLLIAVLLVPLAPSGSGVYRITANQFAVNYPDCTDDGTVRFCTVPVGGRTLTVSLPAEDARGRDCTATYAMESLSCRYDYSYGAFVNVVSVGLTVPDETARAVADSRPWWTRIDRGTITLTLLCLLVALALGAAVATWFLSGRPRETSPRLARTTGIMCATVSTLPLVDSLLLLPSERLPDMLLAALSPHMSLAPILVMVLWQMLVGREITGRIGQRLSLTATAFVVALVYSASTLMWVGMAAGLLD